MSRNRVALWLTIAVAAATCACMARGQQGAAPLAEPAGGSASTSTDAAKTRSGGNSLEIEAMRLGFNGEYKVGQWAPLTITLRSTSDKSVSGELAVEVIDGDGDATVVREHDVNIAPRSSTTMRTLVKPGRPHGAVKVRFDSAQGAVERTFAEHDIKQALLATQELFVEIGRSIGLDRFRQFYSNTSLERPVAALVTDPGSLPVNPLGYNAVDVVAVTTSETDSLAKWDARRVDALERWVLLGGKLILCAGRNGRTFATKQERPNTPLRRYPDSCPAVSIEWSSAPPESGSRLSTRPSPCRARFKRRSLTTCKERLN